MCVSEAGMRIVYSLAQNANASSPICSRLAGSGALDNLSHRLNARALIFVTLSGIVQFHMPEHPSKQPSSMVPTPSGILTLLTVALPANA